MENKFGGRWSKNEDRQLSNLVDNYGENWNEIESQMSKRTAKMCQNRWNYFVKLGVNRGAWSQEEDIIITDCLSNGTTKWSDVAKCLPNRTSKQCRERWCNHLNPELKKTPWTKEEDEILIFYQRQLGNSWVKIAQYLSGRSENEVKNRWYSAPIKKRFLPEEFCSNDNSMQLRKRSTSENSINNELHESGDDISNELYTSTLVNNDFPVKVAISLVDINSIFAAMSIITDIANRSMEQTLSSSLSPSSSSSQPGECDNLVVDCSQEVSHLPDIISFLSNLQYSNSNDNTPVTDHEEDATHEITISSPNSCFGALSACTSPSWLMNSPQKQSPQKSFANKNNRICNMQTFTI